MNAATRAVLISVLSTAALLSGCVATAITPSSAQLANVGHVIVVPVEPPPLAVPADVARSLGMDVIRTAVPLTTTPVPKVRAGGGALVLVGGVIMFLELSAAGTPTGEPARLEDVQGLPGTWVPTVVLAEEAAAQLSAGTAFRTVTTVTKYRRLPVGDRSATWHMENWYGPIRAWYSDDTAGIDYVQDTESGTVVLEVGLSNYELAMNRFLVQVMMKVVDPRTGRVIGRTRQYAYPKVGSINDLLAMDSAQLKEVFFETARPLVATALRELGLIPH